MDDSLGTIEEELEQLELSTGGKACFQMSVMLIDHDAMVILS